MDQSAIFQTLSKQLDPQTIQEMSKALGATPAETSSAISAALPALLGGLSGNVNNPQGAASLERALDDHDGSILDNLGGLLGGGEGAASGMGGAILGHIFGGRRSNVEQGVSKTSGLTPQQVAQLLAMLAPIVMGVLGRMKRQGTPVTTELQKQGPGGFGGMLESVLGGLLSDKK
jgi:hypothetical protein